MDSRHKGRRRRVAKRFGEPGGVFRQRSPAQSLYRTRDIVAPEPAAAVLEAKVLVQNARNPACQEGRQNVKVIIVTAVALVACTASALGHHSFAMFDAARTMTVQGTVTQFTWTNPHAWLRIAASDERTGRAVVWSIELDSPARLGAAGIRADYVRAGDTIMVTFHPTRDGSRRGQFIQAVPLGRR